VDPHICPELPGLPPDLSKSEEGVDYLRHLKGPVTENGTAAAPRDGDDDRAALDMAASGINDRRQSPRLRCSGSVEFRAAGSDARLWGTLTDISLHGCYVEMTTTFPVDTKVDLVMKSFGVQIHTTGTVRATYPSLGMGIRFAEIEPVEQLRLKRLLASLAGHSTIQAEGPGEETSIKEILREADPSAIFHEVSEFFHHKQLLSRTEFHQIAKRARRHS
jgi:PilZ domain-containing protein